MPKTLHYLVPEKGLDAIPRSIISTKLNFFNKEDLDAVCVAVSEKKVKQNVWWEQSVSQHVEMQPNVMLMV